MLDEKLEDLLNKRLPLSDSITEHLQKEDVEIDKTEIPRDKLIKILENISSDGAHLRHPDIERILSGFGFEKKLSKDEVSLFKGIFDSRKKTKPNKLQSVIETKKDAAVEQLENDIKNLTVKLNEISDKENPQLIQLKESVEKIVIQSKKVAAPIKIPSPKNMEVQLVSADSLQRLSEYNSDINILLTLSAVFLGAFLGMLGNLVFSTSVTNQAYGVIAILGVVSTLFFCLFYRADTRKKVLSNDILNDDDGVYLDDFNA
jgi:hypothetical protein